jgi:hypothetical protein
MSVQLAPKHVLERIAQEYAVGGRYADRHLPQLSKVAAIVAADPLSAINKRLASVVANGGASATKMLRLYAEASASGLQAEALKELITKEADRLLDRALVLSARHGSRARVRIATLRAMHVAGFIQESALKLVETNMLTQKQVRELVSTYNGVDAIRWEQLKKAYNAFFQEPTSPQESIPVVAKTRTSHQIRLREAGIKAKKPLTKAAYLKLATKKAFAKASRQANAKLARAKRRGNGKVKHSVGESPMCAKPLFELCEAGHVGIKVAK